jgi:glycosyltransferase involved in cell wall biosynthesis
MRILIDLQACQTASRHRGIGRYSLAMAEALTQIAEAHEVSLLLNAAFPDSVEWLRDRFATRVPTKRIHVFAAPGPVAEFETANRWRVRAAESVREAFVASLEPDVLLVSSLFEGFVDDATTSIASTPRCLSAATLYDLIPLIRPTTLESPAAKAWYERKLESLRRADLFLAISDHSRAEAIATAGLAAENVVAVSAGADPCFRVLAPRIEAVQALRARHGILGDYALYAGGYDPRKNVVHLIAAFAALDTEMRRRYSLVLAGSIDEQQRRELLRCAEQHRLSADDVLFTGYIDDDELALLYNACTVFVFPSLHEGFGLPVLEAMACGAAVIGSRTTSIPEVIGRADALFDPVDVAATAKCLREVLSDDGFRLDLQRYGIERSKTFSWRSTARRALDAMIERHERSRQAAGNPVAAAAKRAALSLAFVSPLPPERTGVAYYSVELLAPLRDHYRIELVTDQQKVDLPAELAAVPVRSLDWFDTHADDYDRILYQVGNSPFHHRMFDLLERHPGTVVLHDLHLGGVLNWMDQYGLAPGIFANWLFESHGYPGLIADRDIGRDATIDDYPCSWPVIDRASGVIVHSGHASRLADRWFRIGRGDWRQIPQLRRLPGPAQRDAARRSLGIAPDDVVFCSFGFVDATKLDDRIVDAWLRSVLATDPRCVLVFVGEMAGSEYGANLRRRIDVAERIRITGYVDAAKFDDYLAAADAAIQLRGVSRGETSRTALDCLANGLPLIVNSSGSLAELPDDVVVRLPSIFTDEALAEALTRIARDPGERLRLGRRAREYIADRHDPHRIADAFHDAIEHFAQSCRQVHYRTAVRRVAEVDVQPAPDSFDWQATADSIAIDLRRAPARQILVDVSSVVRQDLRTGIERVVRAVLRELLHRAPVGWRVEPVMAAHGCYLYARSFTTAWLGLPPTGAGDTPVEISHGDAFLGLDWAANVVPDQEPILQRYRTLGVDVTFIVYDLLPVTHPDFYPAGIEPMHGAWLATLGRTADGLLCISNAVADDLVGWLGAHNPRRASSLKIGVLPLGADLQESVPSRGLPENVQDLLDQIAARTSVLMVGTVEPRKGHTQVLEGFESLWDQGVDVNLVIVGKQGWMVDDLASSMRNHPALGRRLFWFEDASDEWVEALYANVDLLLAASLGEGYGLPLIEAARHGVPLLVRDLRVFREVAGDHATYFSGTTAEALARAVADWMKAASAGHVPASSGIRGRTWRECVDALLEALIDGQWQRTWRPDDTRVEGTATTAERQIDFSRAQLPPAIRTIKGLSAHEQWGRWSDANVHPQIEIGFRDPLPAIGTLSLTARAFGPNVGEPIRVRIGSHETELRFRAHDTTAIVTYAVGQRPMSVEIVPPHPVRPRELGPSHDARRLGIGLVRLTIQAA